MPDVLLLESESYPPPEALLERIPAYLRRVSVRRLLFGWGDHFPWSSCPSPARGLYPDTVVSSFAALCREKGVELLPLFPAPSTLLRLLCQRERPRFCLSREGGLLLDDRAAGFRAFLEEMLDDLILLHPGLTAVVLDDRHSGVLATASGSSDCGDAAYYRFLKESLEESGLWGGYLGDFTASGAALAPQLPLDLALVRLFPEEQGGAGSDKDEFSRLIEREEALFAEAWALVGSQEADFCRAFRYPFRESLPCYPPAWYRLESFLEEHARIARLLLEKGRNSVEPHWYRRRLESRLASLRYQHEKLTIGYREKRASMAGDGLSSPEMQ